MDTDETDEERTGLIDLLLHGCKNSGTQEFDCFLKPSSALIGRRCNLCISYRPTLLDKCNASSFQIPTSSMIHSSIDLRCARAL